MPSSGPAKVEKEAALTNDMMRIIQSPGNLQNHLGTNILQLIEIQFEGSQGYINGKDL